MGRHCDDGYVSWDDFCVPGDGVCGYPFRFGWMDPDFCPSVFCIGHGNLRIAD